MHDTLNTYLVTITDTVAWSARFVARDDADARAVAWQTWESDDRDLHFIDRNDTSVTVEHVGHAGEVRS